MVTRFAPSPTGRLHLGHVYSARLAWERACKRGGRFLLRFEDIDHTRVREEYYSGIEEDLRWLGLDWEESPWRQLERLGDYELALERLRNDQLLYPCFCTRRELAVSAPQQGDGSVIYSGRCRALTEEERKEKFAQGLACGWRLDMAKASRRVGKLDFEDERFGNVTVQSDILGDVILARKDIATSYHLAVVVDDAAQGITEVIRGEDLLSSTHVHRVLQDLLELPQPTYFHHELVSDSEGKRLAKRHDALAIATLREEGWSPRAVLAKVGMAAGKHLG